MILEILNILRYFLEILIFNDLGDLRKYKDIREIPKES
tara:strand:+ start:593 stop:706 length:114 start_codon:yes stop_codon:yes gene_type:complete